MVGVKKTFPYQNWKMVKLRIRSDMNDFVDKSRRPNYGAEAEKLRNPRSNYVSDME